EPLLPYQRLRQLGEHARDHLLSWILEGRTDCTGVVPRPEVAGSVDSAIAERQQALAQWFDGRQRRYEQVLDQELTPQNFFATPRVWEVRDDVRRAFAELIRLTGEIEQEPDPD